MAATAWSSPPVRHHSTHEGLLHRDAVPPGAARVDAIIVPAARHSSGLEPAIGLAQELGCPVVALCSQDADQDEIRRWTWAKDAQVVAVDVRGYSIMQRSRTAELLEQTPFARRTDTAMKRNVGLALTHMTGWQRVLALDDDITGVEAAAVTKAAALLPAFGAVGLHNIGFPDNSVVCHANRQTGGDQGTFVGGGAMLFPGHRATSFFPDIYNEDWFFLLDDERLVDVAVHGTFEQAPFDPYPNPRRAGAEEFGDCLAEGLFALLDDGRTLADADFAFWQAFLAERHLLISSILARIPSAPFTAFRRTQMTAALLAARTSLEQVDPELCVAYLNAWRRDLTSWRRLLKKLPQQVTVEHALAVIGLKA